MVCYYYDMLYPVLCKEFFEHSITKRFKNFSNPVLLMLYPLISAVGLAGDPFSFSPIAYFIAFSSSFTLRLEVLEITSGKDMPEFAGKKL